MKRISSIMIRMCLLTLLLTPFIGLSQNIQSKGYQIDNTNKLVTIPFNDVYIWSNYFIRYEFLNNSNIELNQYLTKSFQIDSANKVNHTLVYNTFVNLHKQDSIQKSVLEAKIVERDVKIDTLKKHNSDLINKNFVTNNVTIPLVKVESYNSGKTKGKLTGLAWGTPIGIAVTILLKILIKF
jgi:hypothetical protein